MSVFTTSTSIIFTQIDFFKLTIFFRQAAVPDISKRGRPAHEIRFPARQARRTARKFLCTTLQLVQQVVDIFGLFIVVRDGNNLCSFKFDGY